MIIELRNNVGSEAGSILEIQFFFSFQGNLDNLFYTNKILCACTLKHYKHYIYFSFGNNEKDHLQFLKIFNIRKLIQNTTI